MDKKEVVKIVGVVKFFLGIIICLLAIISTIYIPQIMINKHYETYDMLKEVIENQGLSANTDLSLTSEATTSFILGLDHLILFYLLEVIIFILGLMLLLKGIVSINK